MVIGTTLNLVFQKLCMLVLPNKIGIGNFLNVYIGYEVVKYVTELRYLGHVIKESD